MNVMVKRHDHIIEILYRMFAVLKKFLFPFVLAVVSYIRNPTQEWILGVAVLVIILSVVTISFLTWKSKTFEITNHSIRISEGLFSKKINEIPLTNIQSINTSHSFFKKICDISNLNIEVIGGEPIFFVLSNKDILLLKEQLFHDLKTESNEKNFLLTTKDILFISCNPIHFFKGFSIIFGWVTFLLYQLKDYLNLKEKTKETEFDLHVLSNGLTKELKASKEEFTGPLEPLIQFLLHNNVIENSIYLILFLFVSYLIGFVLVFLKYRSFFVDTNQHEISIRFGVFNQKLYHVPKNKIRSIQIIQPYYFKWFGYVKLKIENIGLGLGNTALEIAPVLKEKEVETFLHTHLPDFKNQDVMCKPTFHSLPFYIGRTLRVVVVLFAFLGFIWQPLFYLYGLLPFFIAKGYLNWKYAGLTYNEHFFTISKGNLFHSKKVIFLKKYVEVLETEQSFIQKRMNVLDYGFSVYSEHIVDTHTCRDLDEKEKIMYLLMRKEKTHA